MWGLSMRYKGIIFDMDGVLVDSEPIYLQEVIDYILDELKEDVGYLELKREMNKIVGASDDKMFEIMSEYLNHKYSPEEIKASMWSKELGLDYRTILNPHVLYVLPKLKAKGYKLAIASSSSMENIKTVTRQCGIDQYFDCMVSGVDFKESKPDPAIYLETLRRLDLKPEEVIAIEDSTYGIQACMGANIRVIAKEDNRYDFNQDLADEIASDILDAYNIIKYWNLEENYFFSCKRLHYILITGIL